MIKTSKKKFICQSSEGTIRHLIYKTIGTTVFVRRMEWRKMFEYLEPKEGERILDIACGNGTFSLKIAERGCKVYGIDILENEIKAARRLAEREGITCEFMVGNAEDLPYPDEYFNKIACSCSLEHFNDDIKALREMSRVLKPGGYVVMTVDSFTYSINDELRERHRKLFHVVNYYTRETLKEKFEIVGIKVDRSEYLLNSRITSFFFNYFIIKSQRSTGILEVAIHLLAHPFCLVSDKLFGLRNKGYTLIVKGRKINS